MPRSSQPSFVGRVRKDLSPDRLAPYHVRYGEPTWEALARYAWNVAICEAFYPLLHHLEVVLRNRLNELGRTAFPYRTFADVDSWLDAHPSPLHRRFGLVAVQQAKRKLLNAGSRRRLTGGDLVAALDFGFWTGLFNNHYLHQSGRDRRLWPHGLAAVFPHATTSLELSRVRGRLNDARKLRNRVFHHEPVWRRPNLEGDRRQMFEMLRWMSPEVARTVAALDRLPAVLSDDFRRRLRVRIYRESRS